MTQTPVNVVTVTRSGVTATTPTPCDAVNGNSLAGNNNLTWLEFTNSDTASHTVTIAQGAQDAVASPGKVLTIPATTTKLYGYWPSGTYGNTLTFTVDSALVKVAAYQLGQ